MSYIIHVLEHLRIEGGGLPAAVSELASKQSLGGVCSIVIELVDKKISLYSLGVAEVVKYESKLSFWRAITKLLQRSETPEAIVHAHGVWCPLLAFVLCLVRLSGLRYVISFHGQLMPNLIESDSCLKALKKRVYLHVLVRGYVFFSQRLHSVTEAERGVLYDLFGQQKNVSVIYNYVSADVLQASARQVANDMPLSGYLNKKILFMARLDPRKGVEQLIRGFAMSDLSDDWQLEICGADSDGIYSGYLSQVAHSCGVGNRVKFKGLVKGKERIDAFRSSMAVCLPSVSEVLALSNIEAALFSRLVLTTYNSGFPVQSNVGALRIECDAESIAVALGKLSKINQSEYSDRVVELRRWALGAVSPEALDCSWSLFYKSAGFE